MTPPDSASAEPRSSSWSSRLNLGASSTWVTPRTALFAALFALAGMLWLPFHLARKAMPIPSFHAEAAAATLGLLALSALLPFAGRLPVPRVVWLPFGFVLLLLLQLLLGMVAFRQQALLAALYLLWAGGLILLAALLRRELGLERVATVLAWTLFAGALTSAVIGVAQLMESYDLLGRFMVVASSGRVWANLAQPNHLADYLSLGLVSIAYLYASGRLRMAYALAAGLLVGSIVALTGSRSPGLYLGTLSVLAAVFFALERSPANRRLTLFMLLALATYWVVTLTAPFAGAMTSIQRSGIAPGARSEHAALWQAAWLMFRDAPWLGQGFRQYGYQYFLLAVELPQPRMGGFNDHAHNLVLHVMAEFGLVGLALLLAAILPWLARLLRQPRTPALWWVCGLAAVLAIHSLLEYPLWYSFFLGPAALVLGLGEARALEWRPAAGRLRHAGVALAAMLLLGWLVLAQVFRDYMYMEDFAGLRYKYLHATPELDRQARDTLLTLHRDSLLSPWVELGLARTIHIDPERLADKLAVNARAMRAFPIDDVVYRQAMLLALSGDQAGARQQWDRALTVFPQEGETAALVLRRRVEDGLVGLRPLLEHAQPGR